MADTLSKLIGAAGVGSSVYKITGDTKDSAAAAGYGAWVESVTGAQPQVVETPDGRAKVIMTQAQADNMRAWMEGKLQNSIFPSAEPPPSLEIEFGPVIRPIALKYLIVFSTIFFLGGWITRGMIK